MTKVVIDGIEYVPKVVIPELTDKRLDEALRILVSILYFRESHKAISHAWEALHALSPDLAKLAANDNEAAYSLIWGEEDV